VLAHLHRLNRGDRLKQYRGGDVRQIQGKIRNCLYGIDVPILASLLGGFPVSQRLANFLLPSAQQLTNALALGVDLLRYILQLCNKLFAQAVEFRF
jgi:hypothetical protein